MENIVKITNEVDDYLLIQDAFANAINLYNRLKAVSLITDDFNFYKLRYSKKSGLPDLDLPSKIYYYLGIDTQIIIKSSNLRNFSIIVDDSLKASTISNLKSKKNINYTSNVSTNEQNELNITLIRVKEKKKKNCYCC